MKRIGVQQQTIVKYINLVIELKNKYPNGFTKPEYMTACVKHHLNGTLKGVEMFGDGAVIKLNNGKFMFPAINANILAEKMAVSMNNYSRDLVAKRKIMAEVLGGVGAEQKLNELEGEKTNTQNNPPAVSAPAPELPHGNSFTLNPPSPSNSFEEHFTLTPTQEVKQNQPNPAGYNSSHTNTEVKGQKTSKKVSILWGLFSYTTEVK